MGQQGWGETPLNVQWVWPSDLDYDNADALQDFCRKLLAREWPAFDASRATRWKSGTISWSSVCRLLRDGIQRRSRSHEPMPRCWQRWCVARSFDIATHDAFGK